MNRTLASSATSEIVPSSTARYISTVSYRSGQTLEWDAANLQVTNSAAAQKFVHKEYRKGWTL